VYLDNCRVSASTIIGEVPGQGFKTVMKALNKQRINLSALSTGPAIRMLDEAIGYARERQQSGRPIGEYQLVQAMLPNARSKSRRHMRLFWKRPASGIAATTCRRILPG
jgi:acyl-CoA dehydrogenase